MSGRGGNKREVRKVYLECGKFLEVDCRYLKKMQPRENNYGFLNF